MKKLFTLGLMAFGLMVQQASAQIQKGEKMLGGSIGFSSENTEYENAGVNSGESKYRVLTITPQLGFGVGNNWIIGVKAGYAHSKQESVYSSGEQRSNAIDAGVFARRFHTFGDKFGIFGQADASYGFGKSKYEPTGGPQSESKSNYFSASLKPGLFYRTGKRFILEATIGNLGFTHSVNKPDDGTGIKSTRNSFTLGLSNSLSVGFQIVL